MTEQPARTLKDALYNTVHRNDLSVGAIAEEIGMTQSYLYRACLPEEEDGGSTSGVRFPLKKVIPLTRATDDFQILDFMENALGRVAVPIPPVAGCSCRDLRDHALASAADFGKLMQEINQSVTDDVVTTDERMSIKKKGWEAIQTIMQVIQACGI